MPGKLFFTLQYLLNNLPWDTGITPPEVYAYLEKYPPGNALDLGCGTGTNVLTIAGYGWQVTGIDYIPRAIRAAQRKSRQAGLTDRVKFLVDDVLDLSLEDQYDLILDIGCFHSFSGVDIHHYVRNVSNHLSTVGNLLLYVHLKVDSSPGHGSSEEDLTVLANALSLIHRQDGEEGSSRSSAWLWFQKDPVSE